MPHYDAFSRYHPAVQLVYFTGVLLCAMCWMHPLALTVSLLCALRYARHLLGTAGVGRLLRTLLPMLLLAVAVNGLCNHQGVHRLCYLPTGNALTAESLLYGAAAAAMLTAVLLWLACCHAVLTTDRFLYLFGRILPALALLLSMTLRFVPRLHTQLTAVLQAQQGLGRSVKQGTLRQRLSTAAAIVSILLTWCLEDAAETADSMKGRGYGLPKRSSFSRFRFERRDKGVLAWLLLCEGGLLAGQWAGCPKFHYFPALGGAPLSLSAAGWLFCELALCLTPLWIQKQENRTWNSSAYKT